MSPLAVTVIVNGAILAAAPPARLEGRSVMVPLVPIVVRIVDAVAVASPEAIAISAGGRRCIFTIGVAAATCDDGTTRPLERAPERRGGLTYLALDDVAALAGGEVRVDAESRTATVRLPEDRVLVTPTPFDAPSPWPSPSPSPTATPAPTTRPVESGPPQPRRTAIPIGA
jgi:hypothetical protein